MIEIKWENYYDVIKLKKYELLLSDEIDFNVKIVNFGKEEHFIYWSPDVYWNNITKLADYFSIGAIILDMIYPFEDVYER